MGVPTTQHVVASQANTAPGKRLRLDLGLAGWISGKWTALLIVFFNDPGDVDRRTS